MRARQALRLWEMERGDFVKATQLTKRDKETLAAFLKRLDARERAQHRGVQLLLALNCESVPEGETQYFALERYRCHGHPFEALSSFAVTSLSNMYVLAFVKPADRDRAIGFLQRYVGFWHTEASRKDGAAIGESDLAYLQEISAFLEEGGYPASR